MNDIVEFFLAPYHNSPWLYIVLEFTAAAFGVISVFYAKKENILVFPTGIISTGLYVFLLSRWQLYGDLIINILNSQSIFNSPTQRLTWIGSLGVRMVCL
jgi:nicotinamide mononucleotide transporter